MRKMDTLRKSLFRCKACLHNFRLNYRYQAYCNKKEWEPHLVAGIQPTGSLHVGHYFGVINQCVKLQNSGHKITMFIADLHSLTTTQEPARLRRRTLAAAAALLAAGLEPARCTLFAQSAARAHAELAGRWRAWARRRGWSSCHSSASRAAASAHVPLGLLLYPVLQAADIVAQARHRSGGGARDQAPHVQAGGGAGARVPLALRARVPRAAPAAARPARPPTRLLSLRDPARKMAKSDPNRKACIFLTDSDDVIRLKIRKAVTDFTPEVTFDPERRAGVSNLVTLHCLAAELTPEEAVEEAGGLSTAQYKERVAAALIARLAPIRERALRLEREPRALQAVLAAGAAAAGARADRTYLDAARRMGVAAGGLLV
ncbi:hypothetical protein ACJJTC_018441 [Scirpophaga incertulas]